MLQIISGKFFENADCYNHNARGILFSNYSWVRPIETCIGTLEPVDSYRTVSSYVFSYVNQIEKDERVGGLVRAGDSEIVRQFQLLCILGLRAYFAEDRTSVLTNCRRGPHSGADRYVPSQFVARIFDDQLRGSPDEERAFTELVDRAIGMPRARYSALMGALENLDHALQILNYNLDLAYSMLVYCLEALSQGFDEHQAIWTDYDESVRSDIDRHLAAVSPDIAASIRETLLSAAHQKLSARFVAFSEGHIGDAFFLSAHPNAPRQLRRTDLRRALRNAYRLRSGYVHRLAKISQQLHHPQLADGDVFRWDHEPYLTFNGLLRLVFAVLHQFVRSSPHVDKESYAWRDDLPGIVRMQVAPQYWIGRHQGIESMSATARSRHLAAVLGGFMEHVLEVFAGSEAAVTDMRALLSVYEKLIPHAPTSDRIKMLVTYLLWNTILVESQTLPGWREFVYTKHENDIESCCIETLAAAMIIHGNFGDETFEAASAAYERHFAERYSKASIGLPQKVEVRIQSELANLALAAGNASEFRRYATMARCDAVGYPGAQSALHLLIETPAPIVHSELFPFRPPASASAPPDAGVTAR